MESDKSIFKKNINKKCRKQFYLPLLPLAVGNDETWLIKPSSIASIGFWYLSERVLTDPKNIKHFKTLDFFKYSPEH